MQKNKGHDNLIPITDRTEAERKEIASKGGRAKAEKEKQRKIVAETFNAILALEYQGDFYMELDSKWRYGDLSINLNGQTLLTSMCANVVREAVYHNNLRATEIILRYIEPRD